MRIRGWMLMLAAISTSLGGCSKASKPGVDVGLDAASSASAPSPLASVSVIAPLPVAVPDAATAGTVNLVIQRVQAHCIGCITPEPDTLLGYDVLVEVRLEGSAKPTVSYAFCAAPDGGRPHLDSAMMCKSFRSCALADAGDGVVQCGPESVELLSMTDGSGTSLRVSGSLRALSPARLRILPTTRSLRLANID